MFFDRPETGQRAMLLSLRFDDSDSTHNMDEFRELSVSARLNPVVEHELKRHKPDLRTGLGSGKIDTLKEEISFEDIELVIIDCALTPSQHRNLEKALKVRVLTRTELILTLFEERARTHEGKLQVELALLKHAQSSVVGGWSHLDRQRGGVNMRGAGELQSSIDKGLIHRRIHQVELQLERVARHRKLHRNQRKKNKIPTIALAGYTNAGKSTLFNALTEAFVYADDRLFATLDPTLRRLKLPAFGQVLLADTVGFIQDLPHTLVAAFKATLEEVSEADLILHVIDCSSEHIEDAMEAVAQTLKEIDASDVPVINVFNKIDLIDSHVPHCIEGVGVSATQRLGFDELIKRVSSHFGSMQQEYVVAVPPQEGKLRAWLHELGAVQKEDFDETGMSRITASLSEGNVRRVRETPGVSLEISTHI